MSGFSCNDGFAEQFKREVLNTSAGKEALRQEQEAMMEEMEAEKRLRHAEKQVGTGKLLCATRVLGLQQIR
jgi:Rad3-related DNA helicase